MKINRFVLCFVCLFELSIAGKAQSDSALWVIQNMTEDTNKVIKLLQYGETKEDSNYELCKKLYLQAADISRKSNHDFYLSKSYNYLGILCRKYSKNKDALVYLTQSEEAARRCGNEFRVAAAQTNMASILVNENRLNDAVKKLQQAMIVYEKLNMEKQLAQALGNLSVIYNRQRANELSVEVANRGIEIAKRINDPTLLVNMQLNKATPLERLGRFKEAQHLLQDCLPYLRNGKINEQLFNAYQLQAAILGDSKQYLDAIPYADSALGVAKQLQMPYPNIMAIMQRANLATKIEDFGYAHKLLEEANKLASTQKDWTIRSELQRSYFLLERAELNFKEALQHLNNAGDIKDSLQNQYVLQQNLELDKKYATLQKRQQIEQLQKDKELQRLEIKQKNTLIGVSGLVFALLVGILGLLYLSVKRKRSFDKQVILQLQQEKKIKAITEVLQIQEQERSRFARDLHDGLGSLLSGVKLSLSSFSLNEFKNQQQSGLFQHTVSQLEYAIQEMRKISRNMMPDTIQQYGLQTAVRELCESLNSGKTPHVIFECIDFDKRLLPDQELVAYRIVQELLQNAIRHSKANTIIVQLSQHENIIHILVEDDGLGYDATQESKGMGTKNLKSRVEYLNASMTIESKPHSGTSVHVEFSEIV
jgi:two-component system NarL family sensor kinase